MNKMGENNVGLQVKLRLESKQRALKGRDIAAELTEAVVPRCS